MSKKKIIVNCQNCDCEIEIPHIEHEEYCNQCFRDMGYLMENE